MSQSKYAEMELKQAITTFTKLLLWKLHEGHPVANEELEALNSLRASAGMGALQIPKEQVQPQQKLDGPKPQQRQLPEPSEETGLVVRVPSNAVMLPDNAGWKNRFDYTSDSGNTYRIAQNKDTLAWGCTCWPWKKTRNCGHLRDLGLSSQPNNKEVTLKKGSKTAAEMWKFSAELMHSDNDLDMKMEPAQAKEVRVPGPEAGASNDELHASGHSENGENGSPMFDGDMKSPERQNVNAIREALETQVEMEVGKPIQQKQEEMKIQEEVRDEKMMHPEGAGMAGTVVDKMTAKPGTQIVINIAAKKAAGEYADWCDPCIIRLHPEVMMSHAPGHGTVGKCQRCGNNSELRTVKVAMDEKEAAFMSQRVQIAQGSGLDSGKEGLIISWDDPRAKATQEEYPFVGGRTPQQMKWLPVLLDDGSVTAMPQNRLMQIKRSAEPIGGEPEQQNGITSGQGGGMFGGTDLEGPSFHVGFTVKGKRREASFKSLAQTAKFVKDASSKF